MNKHCTGWKTILGNDVWMEDGFILRGVNKDQNGNHVTAYIYRANKFGWKKESRITESAFRSGVNRGTIKLA